jgi:RHS repeat-associated protein
VEIYAITLDQSGLVAASEPKLQAKGADYGTGRKGIRQYELTDHLGNVRAVIGDRLVETTDEDEQTAYAPQLLSATDYFPFGMQMPERVYSASEGYRYGFNGMERENAVNEGGYDFGARLLNTWNGRWLAVDPLFKIYPSISSYAAMGNNPIYFIDVDGRRILIHYKTADNKNAYFEYKPGIKPVDNNFVRLAVATLDHLRLHDEGFGNSAKSMIDQFAYSRGLEVNIKESNTSAEIEISGNQANISWSPFVGSVLVDDTGQEFGGAHSPMILLIHEFGHFQDFFRK